MSAFDTDSGSVLTNSSNGKKYKVRAGTDNGVAGTFHDYQGGGSVFVSANPPPSNGGLTVGNEVPTNMTPNAQGAPAAGGGAPPVTATPTPAPVQHANPVLDSGPTVGATTYSSSKGTIILSGDGGAPTLIKKTSTPKPVTETSTGNTSSGGIVIPGGGLPTNLGGTGPIITANTKPPVSSSPTGITSKGGVVIPGDGLPTNLGGTGPIITATPISHSGSSGGILVNGEPVGGSAGNGVTPTPNTSTDPGLVGGDGGNDGGDGGGDPPPDDPNQPPDPGLGGGDGGDPPPDPNQPPDAGLGGGETPPPDDPNQPPDPGLGGGDGTTTTQDDNTDTSQEPTLGSADSSTDNTDNTDTTDATNQLAGGTDTSTATDSGTINLTPHIQQVGAVPSPITTSADGSQTINAGPVTITTHADGSKSITDGPLTISTDAHGIPSFSTGASDATANLSGSANFPATSSYSFPNAGSTESASLPGAATSALGGDTAGLTAAETSSAGLAETKGRWTRLNPRNWRSSGTPAAQTAASDVVTNSNAIVGNFIGKTNNIIDKEAAGGWATNSNVPSDPANGAIAVDRRHQPNPLDDAKDSTPKS